MPVNAKTEFDIDAPPTVIMEILMDVEALPDWSGPHKKAEIVDEHEDGSPKTVKLELQAVGMTDHQLLNYTWTENTCTWDLIEADQLSHQHGQYTVTPKGEGSHIAFELEVDLKIKLPGLIVKQAQKTALNTAQKGLKEEAKRRLA
ncbi:MAG: cyclase [Gordonia sp.]|nr:cyclase [Gordonia sp. (in: high G+C Gram-positive bacteria)]